MSATRSRQEEKIYKSHLKTQPEGCSFCLFKKGDKQFITQSSSFKVIKNIFAYSIWDGQKVSDHLMLVPKKHIENLGSLSPSQAAEFIKLVDRYEKKGYNVYARAPNSLIKSIPHQHTHLIKTKGKPIAFLMLLRRPFYFRLPK